MDALSPLTLLHPPPSLARAQDHSKQDIRDRLKTTMNGVNYASKLIKSIPLVGESIGRVLDAQEKVLEDGKGYTTHGNPAHAARAAICCARPHLAASPIHARSVPLARPHSLLSSLASPHSRSPLALSSSLPRLATLPLPLPSRSLPAPLPLAPPSALLRNLTDAVGEPELHISAATRDVLEHVGTEDDMVVPAAGSEQEEIWLQAGNIADYVEMQMPRSIEIPIHLNLIFVGFDGTGKHGLAVSDRAVERYVVEEKTCTVYPCRKWCVSSMYMCACVHARARVCVCVNVIE